MKEVQLTKGKVALVDDEDFELVSQYTWFADKKGTNLYYAYNSVNSMYMHRLIMKTTDDLIVDHIDHNGLNNQKSNLRNCTYSQNLHHRKFAPGITGYKGVTYNKRQNVYQAKMRYDGKYRHIGHFKTAIEAAEAYNKVATQWFGEFASINSIERQTNEC